MNVPRFHRNLHPPRKNHPRSSLNVAQITTPRARRRKLPDENSSSDRVQQRVGLNQPFAHGSSTPSTGLLQRSFSNARAKKEHEGQLDRWKGLCLPFHRIHCTFPVSLTLSPPLALWQTRSGGGRPPPETPFLLPRRICCVVCAICARACTFAPWDWECLKVCTCRRARVCVLERSHEARARNEGEGWRGAEWLRSLSSSLLFVNKLCKSASALDELLLLLLLLLLILLLLLLLLFLLLLFLLLVISLGLRFASFG